MLIQTSIDWNQVAHTKENNSFSQGILEASSVTVNGNCKKVYDLLLSGHRLTVNGVVKDHEISSLPRRILDIEKKLKIKVKRDVIQGEKSKYVEYWLETNISK